MSLEKLVRSLEEATPKDRADYLSKHGEEIYTDTEDLFTTVLFVVSIRIGAQNVTAAILEYYRKRPDRLLGLFQLALSENGGEAIALQMWNSVQVTPDNQLTFISQTLITAASRGHERLVAQLIQWAREHNLWEQFKTDHLLDFLDGAIFSDNKTLIRVCIEIIEPEHPNNAWNFMLLAAKGASGAIFSLIWRQYLPLFGRHIFAFDDFWPDFMEYFEERTAGNFAAIVEAILDSTRESLIGPHLFLEFGELACQQNDTDFLGWLLRNRHVVASDRLMKICIEFRSLDALRMLLETGNVMPEDETVLSAFDHRFHQAALIMAASPELEKIISVTQVARCIADNQIELFKKVWPMFVETGTEPEIVECFTDAVSFGHHEMVQFIIETQAFVSSSITCARNNMAIKTAVRKGDFKMVSLLLRDHQVDPSIDDNALLRSAVTHGYVDTLRILLMDDRVGPHLDQQTLEELKALASHVRKPQIADAIDEFIKHHYKPSYRVKFEQELLEAVTQDNVDQVKALLGDLYSQYLRTERRKTLELAVKQSATRVLEYLLELDNASFVMDETGRLYDNGNVLIKMSRKTSPPPIILERYLAATGKSLFQYHFDTLLRLVASAKGDANRGTISKFLVFLLERNVDVLKNNFELIYVMIDNRYVPAINAYLGSVRVLLDIDLDHIKKLYEIAADEDGDYGWLRPVLETMMVALLESENQTAMKNGDEVLQILLDYAISERELFERYLQYYFRERILRVDIDQLFARANDPNDNDKMNARDIIRNGLIDRLGQKDASFVNVAELLKHLVKYEEYDVLEQYLDNSRVMEAISSKTLLSLFRRVPAEQRVRARIRTLIIQNLVKFSFRDRLRILIQLEETALLSNLLNDDPLFAQSMNMSDLQTMLEEADRQKNENIQRVIQNFLIKFPQKRDMNSFLARSSAQDLFQTILFYNLYQVFATYLNVPAIAQQIRAYDVRYYLTKAHEKKSADMVGAIQTFLLYQKRTDEETMKIAIEFGLPTVFQACMDHYSEQGLLPHIEQFDMLAVSRRYQISLSLVAFIDARLARSDLDLSHDLEIIGPTRSSIIWQLYLGNRRFAPTITVDQIDSLIQLAQGNDLLTQRLYDFLLARLEMPNVAILDPQMRLLVSLVKFGAPDVLDTYLRDPRIRTKITKRTMDTLIRFVHNHVEGNEALIRVLQSNKAEITKK